MDALVLKTMNILNTKDDTLAREIVSEIASALEAELCEDLRQECAIQSRTIEDYVSEVNRLTARVKELELSSRIDLIFLICLLLLKYVFWG